MPVPMTSRALLTALCILTLSLPGCRPPTDTYRITEVIDGDTIVIQSGQRVRYIGIDAPELGPPAEPLAAEAKQANRALVEGKEVRLEKDVSDTDRFGRLLRYVYADGTLVNAEMVRQGLARSRSYPPDTKYQEYLDKMETMARRAGRGIWENEGSP